MTKMYNSIVQLLSVTWLFMVCICGTLLSYVGAIKLVVLVGILDEISDSNQFFTT